MSERVGDINVSNVPVEGMYENISQVFINVMCDFFMQWRSLPYLICATKQIGIISEGSPSCIR